MQSFLYNVAQEKDACGTGFVADIAGNKSHAILQKALEAVTNMSHRGGANADGKSGDGAGVLTQIPHKIIGSFLQQIGMNKIRQEDLAVGMCFFPKPVSPEVQYIAGRCKTVVENTLAQNGFNVLGWRKVPVNPGVLGPAAAAECPHIEQVLIARCHRIPFEANFERQLYIARKQVESQIAVARQQASDESAWDSFYVVSLSHRTIVYKGLFIAPQLARFYQDLQNREYETAFAVFHQRYSTNTFPTWKLAQPFRLLAHNGEINTIRGNENWMRAWESSLDRETTEHDPDIHQMLPILEAGGSDSAKLDNATELLTRNHRDVLHAMLMLMPEAYEHNSLISENLRAFYEYHEAIMEPWDGPAAVAFSDGRFVGAHLDRNGLRPARYVITRDGIVVLASEVGAVRFPERDIVEKGRLGPGQILAVDLSAGTFLRDAEIKASYADNRYADWLDANRSSLPNILPAENIWNDSRAPEELTRKKIAFAYGKEVDSYLQPMAETSNVAVGSMGDDTPLTPFSGTPRMMCSYFKQKFAQVTNPPIDPIRERSVMSLTTRLGHRGNFLQDHEQNTKFIVLPSPVLTRQQFEWLKNLDKEQFRTRKLSALFEVSKGPAEMERALEDLLKQATQAVDEGCSVLILSDRNIDRHRAGIPSLLSVSAVHHHLIRNGRRMQVSIVIETGKARNEHHIACLIGYGATCVYPYLAYEVIAREIVERNPQLCREQALLNYTHSLKKGLLKIMAKMGIASATSYHGAQNFEAIGLQKEVVDRYFTGTESRLGGVGLEAIAEDVLELHRAAFSDQVQLPDYGMYRFRKNGEPHSFNPNVMRPLHRAVKRGDNKEAYDLFAKVVERRAPIKLRDLLSFQSDRKPIPLAEVEPVEEILRRFCTTAMSMGALSHEAHLALALGMNRLGARSNSGEGGEDPARYNPNNTKGIFDNQIFGWQAGDSANSKIKQIASGRFGVTPAYLQAAEELEIKMAQGAKPGEGGQLPGFKVNAEIGAIRHAVAGATLISPPPHHDIYSIEDIAQLIYDLKAANPRAQISVKLVAEAGVGAVAAGVAKAYADGIHISGHDGGTGASPLSSIKNTGTPWELGLAEAQHVLIENNLRGRVYLRVDGGLKTGRDVIFAALLGAEQYGFGTSALIAIGCVMARQCHLNTCPVGVATQRGDLRSRFKGHPDHVVKYMTFVAQEVRKHLAALGYATLEETIGRSELLHVRQDVVLPKTSAVNLDFLTGRSQDQRIKTIKTPHCTSLAPTHPDDTMLDSIIKAVRKGQAIELKTKINNTQRAAATRIAGAIAREFGDAGLPAGSVRLHFTGTAGQSFGAFLVNGIHLTLAGEANDYVGKGMAGGEIAIHPAAGSTLASHENIIIGNTVMYGATGGRLFAAGQAGERFCVRNSGGIAVVEGVGDHGCEYMTRGTVLILAEVGRNFGAGMTGGVAYILDEHNSLRHFCNTETIQIESICLPLDCAAVRTLLQLHSQYTGSKRARDVLQNWPHYLPLFRRITSADSTEAAHIEDFGVEPIMSVPAATNS